MLTVSIQALTASQNYLLNKNNGKSGAAEDLATSNKMLNKH